MIVASLLLPVAVLFLALGVVNGSSSLLITSIVVSLLAAVALVIGTRQAAARRGAASAGRPARREQAPAFAEDSAPAAAPAAGDSGDYRSGDHRSRSGDPRSGDYRKPSPAVVERDPGLRDPGLRDPDLAVDLDVVAARAAGTRDAEDRLGDRQGRSSDRGDSDSVLDFGPVLDPAAQGAGEPAWRPADPVEHADEFADPDEDDPDDEPLPQSVRPADAVLVTRIDAEVLVVDGRPRYHMADCPHLVGRLTEALPVNEAAELGFSPCGLCRPVDRLVATVAQQR